jgi:hypothetical protein
LAQEKALGDKVGQQDTIRREVDTVSVYFTVRDDKKGLASDLLQDKFTVSEDGRPQVIKFFAHHSDVVLNVGVLLDTGTNMPSILGEEAQASGLFVKHVVRPTDLGFILGYRSRKFCAASAPYNSTCGSWQVMQPMRPLLAIAHWLSFSCSN